MRERSTRASLEKSRFKNSGITSSSLSYLKPNLTTLLVYSVLNLCLKFFLTMPLCQYRLANIVN